MNISNLSASVVLEETFLDDYKIGMDHFYSELAELNTIIYLSEKIANFPFDLFCHEDETIFFSTVMKSFHNSAILITTKMITDKGDDLFTLLPFKKRILFSIKPEFQNDFKKILKENRFTKRVESLLEEAKNLRIHFVAHTKHGFVLGNVELFYFSISKLKELRDALNLLLNIFSFDVELGMLPIEYDDSIRSSYKIDTDIEKILKYIAKNSYVLNMYEENPDRWQIHRKKLNKNNLKILNQYRKKFSLPKI